MITMSLSLNLPGKGAITTYTSYNTSTHTSFSWTRGGMITITHTDGTKEQYKFNLKEGVLNILLTYEDTEYTITYKSMTDEIRQEDRGFAENSNIAGRYLCGEEPGREGVFHG